MSDFVKNQYKFVDFVRKIPGLEWLVEFSSFIWIYTKDNRFKLETSTFILYISPELVTFLSLFPWEEKPNSDFIKYNFRCFIVDYCSRTIHDYVPASINDHIIKEEFTFPGLGELNKTLTKQQIMKNANNSGGFKCIRGLQDGFIITTPVIIVTINKNGNIKLSMPENTEFHKFSLLFIDKLNSDLKNNIKMLIPYLQNYIGRENETDFSLIPMCLQKWVNEHW